MRTAFTTVRTEGGILPADLLMKIVQRDTTIGGVSEESYHVTGEKLNEAISRSWNRLLGVWRGFEEAAAKLPSGDFGTSITREKWLLPLFEELHYGRLKARTFEIDGTTVPISHGWENVPIHLVGFRISIDKRTPGAAGAAKKSPHSLLQEYLNRSTQHLWGIVSNGETLRLLRDNVALTRQAYVEFDLKAMMDGEVYSDFALLWMLCHQSRVDAAEPQEFWLERWSKVAQDVGVRALDQLRDGVSKAIEALGAGFLGHPDNQELRDRLAAGDLDKQEYYRQLLRIVYRLLFLFVAEDRDLLLVGSPEAQQRYRTYYSTQRLRQLAASRRGTRHSDLYEQVRFVFERLGADDGCEALALKPLGGFLFSAEATAAFDGCTLANADLLSAVRNLSVLKDGRVTRVVDFRNLRSEELGSVYEALLEMHPDVHLETGTFELKTAAGNERKTTGSYYTPESLVQLLLDSALDPVLAEAAAKPRPEDAILALKVCDPACGSGHFLIAAAHRIAKKLASVRTGDEEANPEAVRKALRDVIGHCIHGVDINPMAVELCKVALWMEALDPGRPLSFLEQKIQCGNSLLGATPELLAKGIPDAAFDPIEGDDKEICKQAKAQNKKYRETKQATFDFSEPWNRLGDLASGLMQLDESSDETLADVRKKEQRWKALVESTGYMFGQLWADAWCAAFVWRKTPDNRWPITEETFRKIEHNPYSVDAGVREEIRRLAEQYQFFHWHLRFPSVFPPNGRSGFDVVLGNPPWEAEELIEKEFFAAVAPEIATIRTKAKRAALIERLASDAPGLFDAWISARRAFAARASFCRESGVFPLGAVGKLNTYRLFAELGSNLTGLCGRYGQILKSGIVSAQDSQQLFNAWSGASRVFMVREFINTKLIFPAVVANERFCCLVLTGIEVNAGAPTYAFGLETVEQARDESRSFRAGAEALAVINANDQSVPPITSQRDFELVLTMHANARPVRRETADGNPWNVRYAQGHLNSASDSSLFADNTFEQLVEKGCQPLARETFSTDGEIFVPLYEGKYIAQQNHRFATFERVPVEARFGTKAEAEKTTSTLLADPLYEIRPRYWLSLSQAETTYDAKRTVLKWLFAFRDVCRAIVDARTVQACVMPRLPCLDGAPLLIFDDDARTSSENALYFNALWASFPFDYVARQKIHGAHLTKAIAYQLPMLPRPAVEQVGGAEAWRFIQDRALELTVVADSLVPLAVDLGRDTNVFRWDELRRFHLRCELDAFFFHLYGISRDDAAYIMETFEIVRDRDERAHGEYRTKRLILEIYDRMQQAKDAGVEYQTILDPPPADPRVAHSVYKQVVTAATADPWRDLGDAAASEAWRLPTGVSYSNLVLFALIDVLKKFGASMAQDTIRTAVALTTNPALAVAVLEPEQAQRWIAAVGTEARPLPANVKRFTFQRGGVDHDWADAIARAKAGGLLIEDRAAGTWSLRPGAEGSGQPWVEGRAAVAVAIVKRFEPVELEQNLVRFAKDVTDGKAARDVS